MKDNQLFITLHPADLPKLNKHSEKVAQKPVSIIREIVHLAVNGDLVRKESKRNYFDLK